MNRSTQRELRYMLVLTITRVIGGIGALVALLLAAILWPGPGHPWPLEPTYWAIGLLCLYLGAGLLFVRVASKTASS